MEQLSLNYSADHLLAELGRNVIRGSSVWGWMVALLRVDYDYALQVMGGGATAPAAGSSSPPSTSATASRSGAPTATA